MNAKSYYFDNQIFNTSEQFHEYLTNKFNIDEKLTNKIPSNYTIDRIGELSRQVLLDDAAVMTIKKPQIKVVTKK